MQLLCVWKYICTSSTTQLCHDFSGRSSRDAEILLYICHEKVLGLVSSLQEERDIDGNKLEVYTGQKKICVKMNYLVCITICIIHTEGNFQIS